MLNNIFKTIFYSVIFLFYIIIFNFPDRESNLNKDIAVSEILLPNEGSNKDTNFEYEEEWDVGGIPELLNELDADIEKSFKVDVQHHSSKTNYDKDFSREVFTLLSNEQYDKHTISKKQKKPHELENSENKFKHASTFAGFSKGGHLISSSSKLNYQIFAPKSATSADLDNQINFNSMSSQSNNNNNGGNLSSAGINNISSSQSGASTNSSGKSNTKMSIDHQATLDKGLKMKIKRTKPGTKSSEAKHEIVKATEQQQNGISGNMGTCINHSDDNISISSASAISPNTQISVGSSNIQNITPSGGNKKNVSSNGSQLNSFSSGGNNISSGVLTSNISNQSTSSGTKRTNSSHRRDKIKEKSSHSNRALNEKNISQNNEKDPQDKVLCNCNIGDDTTSVCSVTCIHGNEGSSQRLSTSIVNNTVVPPGVFIPSADTSNSSSAPTLLSVSTTVTSSVVTNVSTISGAANTPGPPNREGVTGGNIKISSHIAAQLAAAAASNSSSVSSVTNTDVKQLTTSLPEPLTKQTTPGTISATVHHNKPSVANSTTTNSNIAVHNLTDEVSKSPPSKRAKHSEYKTSGNNSGNKETVDICIGTSVGTITEPDCLGPCEPGTSVTLEGIVWHETEGGVLVVNVTWRGKTYVGTLLDCTRHDWAPPR